MMIGLMMTRKRNSTTQQREEKTNKARDLKLENYDERFMTFRTEGLFVSSPGNIHRALSLHARLLSAEFAQPRGRNPPQPCSIHYTKVRECNENAPL